MEKALNRLVIGLISIGLLLGPMPMVMATPSDAVNGVQYHEGDWTVVGAESYTNERIYLTGNLTVPAGTSLTLVNTCIYMNCSVPGQYNVTINGTLTMNDANDGLTPMEAGDTDASMITANNTGSHHNFRVGAAAILNVYNSVLSYAGTNLNIPPDQDSGIYLRSASARIEHSLIANNNHGLVFDSRIPLSFLYNNVSYNQGYGLAIGNMANPFYNITATIHDNNFTSNGDDALILYGHNINAQIYNVNCSGTGAGMGISLMSGANLVANIHNSTMWENYGAAIYMRSVQNITGWLHDLNISENAYGVSSYADGLMHSLRMDRCTLMHNDAAFCADPDGPVALYLGCAGGTIDFEMTRSALIENWGARSQGCILIGADAARTFITMDGNDFIGNGQTSNDAIQYYYASSLVDAKFTRNRYLGTSLYNYADNMVIDSNGDINFDFSGNTYDDMNCYTYWSTIYVSSNLNMNVTMNDNTMNIFSDGIREPMNFFSNTGTINFEMNRNEMNFDNTDLDDYLFWISADDTLRMDINDNQLSTKSEITSGSIGTYDFFYTGADNEDLFANITGNDISMSTSTVRNVFYTYSGDDWDMTFSDNTIRGDTSVDDLEFILYGSTDDYINSTIEGNQIELLNGKLESIFFMESQTVNAEVCDNNYYGNSRLSSWNGGIGVEALDADVTVAGNRMVTQMLDSIADWDSTFVLLDVDSDLDATISGNYFECTDSGTTDNVNRRMVYLGDESSPMCNVNANVTDNQFVFNSVGAGGIDADGILYITGTGVVHTNITGNEFNFTHYSFDDGNMCYLEGTISIGASSGNPVADDVFANICDNKIWAFFGQSSSTSAAIRIIAENNVTANLERNNVQGIWWQGNDEYQTSEYGVKIGEWGANDGPVTQRAFVTTKDNIFGPGGQTSAFKVSTINITDVKMDGDIVRGAFFGDDCAVTTGDTFGNGISLVGREVTADIRNVNVYDNRGAGIYVWSEEDSAVDIADSWIHDNYWHGMYFESANGIVDAAGSIQNVNVSDNCGDWNGDMPSLGSGLYCINSAVEVRNSTFHNPDGDYDVEVGPGSDVTLLNCSFDRGETNVQATAATLTGGQNPETTLATWNAVTDGSFRITIDGMSRDVAGINFGGLPTMGDVAIAIENAIRAAGTSDGFLNATCVWTGTGFIVASGTVGVNSTIAQLQKHSGSVGTDISGVEASTAPMLWWMDCATNATLEQGTTSHLYVKWYMHVKAEQQGTGFGLPASSVQVRNNIGTVVASGTTGADGFCRNLVVTESHETNDTITGFNPFNASAAKGLVTGHTFANMNVSKLVVVVLNYVTQPPTADAGSDQTVGEGENVTLDGSASTDDFGIANWTWKSGTDVYYGIWVNLTMTVPGTYTFNLTVTDYEGYNSSDEMVVTVLDTTAPIASAGPDQTVNEDTLVTFDGSASTDAAGIANYTWEFTDGTPIALFGMAPTYTFAQPGTYNVTLTVLDPTGNSAADIMTVTVLDVTPPVPHPGAGQTVPVGTQVTLSASGSTDNVGITGYIWTFNDGTNDLVLFGTSAEHRFAKIGNYTLTLTCADGAGNSAFDNTWVNVIDVTPPEVLIVAPGESLTQVPINWGLVIVFTEPMDTESVEAAFSITGTSATGFEWDASGRYVKVNLAELDYDTTYTFAIGANATDVSGNAMTAPFSSTFSTRAAPEEAPVPETGFFNDNWWILVVIIVVLAVLLLVSLLRGKKEEPVPEGVPPAPPAEQQMPPQMPPSPDTEPPRPPEQ